MERAIYYARFVGRSINAMFAKNAFPRKPFFHLPFPTFYNGNDAIHYNKKNKIKIKRGVNSRNISLIFFPFFFAVPMLDR